MQREWVVAMTHPAREFYAASNIRHQQRKFYMPVVFDQRSKRRFPFFRNYLFVHCPDRRVSWLRSTRGISKVVMACDQPLMLENAFIRELKKRENEHGVLPIDGKRVRKYPVYHRGDHVRVNAGPFANVEAIFECVAAHERVRLLLQWLGTRVPAVLPIEQIEPVSLETLAA